MLTNVQMVFLNMKKHAKSNFVFNFTTSQNKFISHLKKSTTTKNKKVIARSPEPESGQLLWGFI